MSYNQKNKSGSLKIMLESQSTNKSQFRYLAIDLEVSPQDKQIHAFAGIRHNNKSVVWAEKDKTGAPKYRIKIFDKVEEKEIQDGFPVSKALGVLDQLAQSVDFVLGHNIIIFDYPHLKEKASQLKLLDLPLVDTLWLNPLAFPQNPYHHLIKHYKDGSIQRTQRNDPHLDTKETLKIFEDQQEKLARLPEETIAAYHWLTTKHDHINMSGFDQFFTKLRQQKRPGDDQAKAAINSIIEGKVCQSQARQILINADDYGWSLAYAIAWLSVSEDGNSVMPPWVRHEFSQASKLIKSLRDEACDESSCSWCRKHHDSESELKHWFSFEGFRPQPKDPETNKPMQQAIVETAMKNQSCLAILPTGTGKSICYQIPALSRHKKTGSLTIVISPLVALMSDQVQGLVKHKITSCVAINGLLSMPERSEALKRVRLGDVAILLISPEQLRSVSVRNAIDQREIGSWVLDEAHCLSKWGHDFRPDYRYIGRFISQRISDETPPPILCLTATAKPEVKDEILKYFHKHLGVEMKVFDGGSKRSELEFEVMQTSKVKKHQTILSIINDHQSSGQSGGVIIYCSTRRQTEKIAEMLKNEVAVNYFHAGLNPEEKKEVQEKFIEDNLEVIVATNAFGMGIDKPNVRLVIHADIPSSLENYLQEAGRAGRDQKKARCILLYDSEDVERQFSLTARSRLSQREINGILKSLHTLKENNKQDKSDDIIVSPGEILKEDKADDFKRDSATDDTRVRTAIAWLEEAKILKREENRVSIYPSSLQVDSVEAAEAKLRDQGLEESDRETLITIVKKLVDADPDDGISTDELMEATGADHQQIRRALNDLEQFELANNDTNITVFVNVATKKSSQGRLDKARSMEQKLLAMLSDYSEEKSIDKIPLNLRVESQKLKNDGFLETRPEHIIQLLDSIAKDGRDDSGGVGSIKIQQQGPETIIITTQRSWGDIAAIAHRRQNAADLLLKHILAKLPTGSRGNNLLAESTLGRLQQAIDSDQQQLSQTKNPKELMERSLLWLHEQEVIRLNKGLVIFRPAMRINITEPKTRKFRAEDYEGLQDHYDQTIRHIHIMAKYAEQGIEQIAGAVQLALDYFSLKDEEFINRWLPNSQSEIKRQTTNQSWQKIVQNLDEKQSDLVTEDCESTNVLVLAGPGSGKTRVLVHRIGYLIRCKRQNPNSILALAYNRHAAAEIRQRLRDLIGDDSRGVVVLTCHALAMRLTGHSFSATVAKKDKPEDVGKELKKIIKQATALLKGEDAGEELEPEDVDDLRSRLLAGFRWILVDEYQDIGPEEYGLISGLTGRESSDQDTRLTIFAVGDDDQNIYAFNGTSPEFIRDFAKDYDAKVSWLIENYRSSSHIINAANQVIAPASGRMKTNYPIQINKQRMEDKLGGTWEDLDPISRGRVQIIEPVGDIVSQAQVALTELQRLASLTNDWDWSRCAVIAREWQYLDPVRSICELEKIPVQLANENDISIWHLRETQALKEYVEQQRAAPLQIQGLKKWVEDQLQGPWANMLFQAVAEFELEVNEPEVVAPTFVEWLAEWCQDTRQKQSGLLLLTAHRAKGLEFDHVVILDGGWDKFNPNEDKDAPRRLYYVAMTRAKQTLTLTQLDKNHPFHNTLRNYPSVEWRPKATLPQPRPEMRRHHRSLGLKDVFLSFAGYKPTTDPVHRAITALNPGDKLQVLKNNEGGLKFTDSNGVCVGTLAKQFEAPADSRCIEAKVSAVAVWAKDKSKAEYQQRLKSDRWEVVIPELVFEKIN